MWLGEKTGQGSRRYGGNPVSYTHLGLKSETDMVALNCEALCAVTRMVLPLSLIHIWAVPGKLQRGVEARSQGEHAEAFPGGTG